MGKLYHQRIINTYCLAFLIVHGAALNGAGFFFRQSFWLGIEESGQVVVVIQLVVTGRRLRPRFVVVRRDVSQDRRVSGGRGRLGRFRPRHFLQEGAHE